MLGFSSTALQFPLLLGQADPMTTLPGAIAPTVVLVLCIAAGAGTVLLLPSRREASVRRIGGAVLVAVALVLFALLVRWTADSDRGGVGVYFWLFSAIALTGAIRVITHPRPVYSALYFVLTVFATAGLFLLLKAEFMAAALVLIYAGAILVTYVFVIMLASEASTPSQAQNTGAMTRLSEHDAYSREPVVACAVGFALMGVLLLLIFDRARALTPAGAGAAIEIEGATQKLGAFLFANEVMNLELAGLILTVAMVGAIMIARKRVISDVGAEPVQPEVVVGPATPVDDSPHSIPVYGTRNARQKAYPET